MSTNIEDLLNKVENGGATPAGKLSAPEFVRMVQAVMENQGSVHSVSLNNGTPVSPDGNGNVNLVMSQGNYEQILSVRYNGNILDGESTILSGDGNVVIGVQYKESRVTSDGSTASYSPTGQTVTLTVIGFDAATGNPRTLLTRALASVGHSSTVFTDINLTDHLVAGEQSIQVRISDTINNEPFQQIITVIKANMELRVEQDAAWYRDAKIMTGSNAQITVRYIVLGAVTKSLHVKFTGATGSKTVDVTGITSNDPNTVTTAQFVETTGNDIGFFGTNGVREVEAWITCSADGQTVESNHIVNHVIVVADPSSASPMIALQSKITTMPNYETATIFSWNMYNPALASGETSDVLFVLANQDKTTTYISQLVENVENNTTNSFSQNVSIEASGDYIDVYIFAEVDGEPVGSAELAYFQVDNTIDYSAVSGADFYLNPGLRSNSESTPAQIINAADGNAISGCTFENMSWQDGVDGWMQTVDGRRVLRVAAGGKVTIPYSVYSQFVSNSRHFLTIEIDFAARNVTNEDDPVITMGNALASNPKGVFIKPLNGAFVTASQTTWDNADVSWQENTRTHLVFNICHNYTITNPDTSRGTTEPTTKTLSLVRTYINGRINKEYTFDPTEANEINAGGNIVIGQSGCDIDIYAIRIYKDTNDKSNLGPSDVIKNFISSLPTGAERAVFKAANDILSGGLISLQKALAAGYNCIVWHGLPVNKSNSNETKRYGYAEIYRHNADGTLDRSHSGILYGIEMKGQGTTAMGYAEWNVQYKEDKETGAGHDEYKYNTGTALKNVFVDVDGNAGSKFGYRLDSGDPAAKKLVGKVNYASSMQSHKMGACNLYNDLYASIVSNSVTDFNSGERVTVKEEPFLYFVQRTEGNDDFLKVFQGLMTFGPGKADKPTWGVSDADLAAGDCIIEGSLNNNPLTDARVPFVDGGAVTYSADNEAFMYAGEKNLNFDYGDTIELHDGQGGWAHNVQDKSEPTLEVPTAAQVKLIQPIWNFLYLCNTGIKPWNDTLAALNDAALDADFDYQSAYWMNGAGDGYSRFDLYRCHYTKVGTTTSREFVPAGIRLVQGVKTFSNFNTLYATVGSDTTSPQSFGETDMWYDTDTNGNRTLVLNLKSELEAFLGITITTSGVSADAINTAFRTQIANLFASFVNSNIYLHKQSHLFHHEIMKMWAGTDNRSKNTYYRLNPRANAVTVNDETTYRPNMEMNDDDLDTIFKTNNSGIQSKPYYILEHDTDSLGRTYWDGQNNILNNTIEATYGRSLGLNADRNNELQAMMKTIFTRMTALVRSGDTMPDGTAIANTPLGCMDKYFFKIQRYFPAVAYNETARIRYEVPATFYMAEQPAQAPLTQSLGDQYDSEREYIKRRFIMLSGYAGYEMDMLSFRGYLGQYVTNLKPHYWLYPMSKLGNPSDAPVKSNVRVAAGESFALAMGTAVSGNTIFLHFINELSEIGNIGTWGNGQKDGDASTEIAFTSERLKKFECYGATAADVSFPLGVADISGSTNIERVDCHNCSTLTSFRNGITSLMRLNYLDLRGTAVTALALPQTTALQTVLLPSGFTTINITRCPNLETLSLQSYSALTSVAVTSSVQFDTMQLVQNCLIDGAQLQTLNLRGINWTNCTTALLEYLVNIPNVSLAGSITMSATSTGQIGFALKKKIIDLFGNVDSESNPLRISYTRVALGNVDISGDGYFSEVGESKHYDIMPIAGVSQNTITGYTWSIDAEHQDWATVDSNGNLTCLQIGVEQSGTGPEGTLTVVVDALDSSGNPVQRTASMAIRFYIRSAKVGDYVYHDGTYDNRLNRSKDVVGICFYINPDDPTDRRMVARSNAGSFQWGLYPTGSSGTTNGFPDSTRYDLTPESSSPTLSSPFDIPSTLSPDITTKGCTNQNTGADSDYVRYNTMIDPQTGDFVDYSNSTAVGRGLNTLVALGSELKDALFVDDDSITAETLVPRGFRDTCGIILHRTRVLMGTTWTGDNGEDTNGSYFSPDDQSVGGLNSKITAIRQYASSNPTLSGGYNDRFSQYLYPAASAAFAYQPSVSQGHILNDKFKAHKWYLPSSGELARLAYWHLVGQASSEYHQTGVDDIFLNAVTALIFTRFSASYYWSSTEDGSTFAWYVHFSSGYINSNLKYNSFYVRPCAAF